jgi:hypothetical protein
MLDPLTSLSFRVSADLPVPAIGNQKAVWAAEAASPRRFPVEPPSYRSLVEPGSTVVSRRSFGVTT